MAIRKTGSRRMVVDGVAYRWRIRRRATNFQIDYGVGILHLSIELAERPGAVLVLLTDRPHPHDCMLKTGVIPVLPSDVAGWIRHALLAGWKPSLPGPQFSLRLTGDEEAERVSQVLA